MLLFCLMCCTVEQNKCCCLCLNADEEVELEVVVTPSGTGAGMRLGVHQAS